MLTLGKLTCSNPGQLLSKYCSAPGCLSSSNAQRRPGIPQNNLQLGGKWHSSTVRAGGWIWGSPPWAAIKLLSVTPSGIFPARGCVASDQLCRAPRHPTEVHGRFSCSWLPQLQAKCPPCAHPNQVEGSLVKPGTTLGTAVTVRGG